MRSAGREPLIVRVLLDLLRLPTRAGEGDAARIQRWLASSEVGHALAAYLADESDLLLMAANRLNVSGDEELREISAELARVAERLRTLLGLAAVSS